MINRVTLFFLLIFLLIVCKGCTGYGIDKSTLSTDEIEKVQAVRLIEANELDESSYKVIKKVKGFSCWKIKKIKGWFADEYVVEERPSRKKAVEQAKIYGVRAGANAITNMVCINIKTCVARKKAFEQAEIYGIMAGANAINNMVCVNIETCVECTADAIQVD